MSSHLQVTLENADGGLVPDKNLYPVFVWIHSGNFSYGTAQQQPGHVLATHEVVVVTFNYRIGALGESHNVLFQGNDK